MRAYDCGDICLDLYGCNKCQNQIKGDLLKELKKIKSNQYVIFESCVLEYIDKKYHNEILKELNRVSGGNYFFVRIKPYIFPSILSNFAEHG